MGNTQENYSAWNGKSHPPFLFRHRCTLLHFYLCATYAAPPWLRHIHLKVHFAYVIFKLTLHIFAAVGTLRDSEDTAKQVA